MVGETEVEYCKNKVHGKDKVEVTEEARRLVRKYSLSSWAEGYCYRCIYNKVALLVREMKAIEFRDIPIAYMEPAPPKKASSQLKPGETTLIKVSKVLGITTEAVRDKLMDPEPPRDQLIHYRRLGDGSNNFAIEIQDVLRFIELISCNSPSLDRFTPPQTETLKTRERLGIIRKMITDGALG